ncbi:MAG: zinc-ribbon domain containing protein [Candidatus Beckwithbacteria bacterium]
MNKVIKCQDCNQEFAFTEGEQEYYIKNQLNEPVKCSICRAIFIARQKDKFRGQVVKV